MHLSLSGYNSGRRSESVTGTLDLSEHFKSMAGISSESFQSLIQMTFLVRVSRYLYQDWLKNVALDDSRLQEATSDAGFGARSFPKRQSNEAPCLPGRAIMTSRSASTDNFSHKSWYAFVFPGEA